VFFAPWREPLALLLLCSAASLPAQNLITNGSFESPALSPNTDLYSTATVFTLPGWTYPAGANQFFLENGKPALAPSIRCLDGQQAVCLNGEGTPVSLSQTFPTTAGQNYLLTFGQSDANNGPPTASQLTVTVAGLSRAFSRSNDTGYVVKRWLFTANSNSTILQFTDTTPPQSGVRPLMIRPPSPFLDSVCVTPGPAVVVNIFTVFPDSTGGHEQYPGAPVLGGNIVAFPGLGSAGSQAGIYLDIPTLSPQVIANLNSVIPGGTGKFATFSGTSGRAGIPSISGGMVAFWAADSSWNEGIYLGDGVHPLQAVADTTTAIPGGSGNFTAFTGSWSYPGNPNISGQTVCFFGAGSSGQQGIYSFPSGPVNGTPSKIADVNTAIPGGTGNFTMFTTSAGFPPGLGLDGNNVVFWAGGASGQQGIYQFPTGPIGSKIADLNTAMPGGTGNFTDFVGNASSPVGPAISGGNVAFRGSGAGGRIGVYASLAGTLAKVADTATAIPGGMGMFMDFQAVSLSGDVVAFAATGPSGQMGIYVNFPTGPVGSFSGEPLKVIDLLDTLDGKTLTGLMLGSGGFSGDPLAFTANFSDGSQGIYLVAVVAEVDITAAVRTGADLLLSYTAPAGYNYSIQTRTDLVTGAWATLPGTNYGNGTVQQTTVTNPFAAPRQFYRVQQTR
jgi:hypothetical protein